ncbi:MAG TPA: hypothetical protein VF049_09515 [Nocardioidaceae bacterium]|jgi:hypothetical protein
MRRIVHGLSAAALLATAVVVPTALAAVGGNSAPGTPLTGAMRAAGFRVSPGLPLVYSNHPARTCRNLTYPALKTCAGANPAAPYIIAAVKAWPNEYVEKATVNAFGKLPRGYEPTYRLHPREALVIHGKMPPPGRYTGIQTWQWSQPGHWTAKDVKHVAQLPQQPFPLHQLFATMPPADPTARRVYSFSALGDPLNNVVMQRRSGDPFGKQRYFIVTASRTTDRAVRQVLHARGIPDGHIFTEQIPGRDSNGRIGPLGMGRDAIDFNTWFRYAVPDPASATAAQQWRSDPPLEVLRVVAPASTGPVHRYGALHFDTLKAHSEKHLAGSMKRLVRAVCHRVTTTAHLRGSDCGRPTPASARMVDVLRDYGWDGPYCRSIHMDCDGDNPDTAFFYGQMLPLDRGQVYAVVDTLATETGNATYVGLSAHAAAVFYAPVNILDADLKGSARGYARTVRHTGKFFVHYFTRDCSVLAGLPGISKSCTRLTDAMIPPRGAPNAFGDPRLRGKLQLGIRDYVVPGTARGPDASKILTPVVLGFVKR